MGFVYMIDKEGQKITVNEDYIKKYQDQGWSTDLNKPLDYDKLSPNSVYRQENQANIGAGYTMPRQSIARNGRTTTVGTQDPITTAMKSSSRNNGSISSSGNDLVTALRNRLQQNIANRKAQSQPLINDSEVQKAQDLRTALEMSANAGDRGGIGRQNALETQTAGANRVNAIKLAEAQDIGNMQTEGAVQEAQLKADMLRQSIEDQRYNDQFNYQQSRDAVSEKQYNDAQATNEKNAEIQRFLDTIGQYSGDYQARIDQVKNDGDPSNDWQLDYLNAARQDKIRQQEAAKAQAEADIAKQQEAAIKAETALAWDKWTKNAPLSLREYQLLGIAPGTRYVPPKNTTPISKPSSGSNDYGLNW